jgi:tRNA (adenine37-N6)-methyltransferase
MSAIPTLSDPHVWIVVTLALAIGYYSGRRNDETLKKLITQKDQELLETRTETNRQLKLRQDERQGRVHAERQLRQQLQGNLEANGINFTIIGHIESPFPDRRGTPRQPLLVPAARARIRFNKKCIQKGHFEELAQFSHVWVIFVFHENTNFGTSDKQINKKMVANKTDNEVSSVPNHLVAPKLAKIRPPRLNGLKVGCLSTRSPHRPNEIGLSVCEVVEVGDDYLELRCVDMLNGTPILDGKRLVFCFLVFGEKH